MGGGGQEARERERERERTRTHTHREREREREDTYTHTEDTYTHTHTQRGQVHRLYSSHTLAAMLKVSNKLGLALSMLFAYIQFRVSKLHYLSSTNIITCSHK